MKFFERNEMMRYLTRPATPKTLPRDTSNEELGTSGYNFLNEERIGFAEAGLASNEPVKAGELLSYLKKYGIDIHPGNIARASQLYGIESPSSGKYILPTEAQIPIIKEELTKNIKSGTTIEGRRGFEERNKLVKELVASEKYNPSQIKDIIQKKYNLDMGNTIQKEINEARKKGKIIPSAKVGETSTNTQKLLYDINLLNENKKIKDILSNPKLDFEKDYSKIVNEVKDTLKINDSKANYRLAYLLQAYSKGEIPSNKNIINNSNKVTASIYADRPFGSLGSVLRRKLQVEPGVASQINEDPKYFLKSRKEISRKLPKGYGYATDEIKGLASSFENLTGRYSVFVQGIKGDINLNKGRTIDKLINTAEKKLQNLDPKDTDYLDKRKTIKNKYNERVKEFTNKYNKNLKKGELPVRGLELSFDSPKDSLARYNELKKINPDLIKGVEDIYSKYNYSFKVPADVKTIPEALGFVKSPEGQKLMQKAADVSAARLYADPTGIGNFLENILDPALKKLEPFAKTAIKSPLAKGVGKFGLSEIAAAPFFSALDYGAGLEPSEIALNIPTLGLGTTAKDYGTAVLNLPKKQRERLGEIFSQETTLPEVDEDIVKNISKTYEDLEKKRAKVAESRIQPPGSFEEPFIPLGPLINKQEVKDDLYIPSLPKKNLVEREGVLNLAFGGRVGFKDGPKDPSKRKFIKGAGIAGAAIGILNLAPDLFKQVKKLKAIPKKASFVNIVRPLGATETKFPEWFPSLVNRLRKEGDMKPIYATEEIPLTKEEYLKLSEKGTDRIYDEHLTRTQEYIDEFEKTGKPRYYQIKDTDDIIGYQYIDKNLPDVKAVEYNGEEMNVYFKNYYDQPIEIQYVAPGKKSKEGQFAVADVRPEPGSGYDSAPDFEQVYVTDIDEVLGGSGKVEQYATKAKTPRYTKGEAAADDAEGRAMMEIDRLKDEGLIDD